MMNKAHRLSMIVIVIVAAGLMFTPGRALAQRRDRVTPGSALSSSRPSVLSLAKGNIAGIAAGGTRSFARQMTGRDAERAGGKSHDYREISDFFNVREANVNTVPGEWELELEGNWTTNEGEGDDNFTFTPNIKYGLNDDMFIELEVLPLNLGDGDEQGNGDFSLQLFNQFTRESDTTPAIAAWVEGRFPTGEGSSGVDGELHLNVTQTLFTDIRGHWEGFIETANGGRGDEDENRRSFQWGSGVGFDYQLDDKTICTLNYLNRSSDERGEPNQNILEIGGVRQIAEDQHFKFALDIGLDGHEETPDFGVKLMWTVEW